MYIIMAYDINVERVNKILKIGRKYLNWIQNSLLEGELTVAQFEKLKYELNQTIQDDEDSVIFYILKSESYIEKQALGISKNIISNIV